MIDGVLHERAHGHHHGLWQHPKLLELHYTCLDGCAKLSHRGIM